MAAISDPYSTTYATIVSLLKANAGFYDANSAVTPRTVIYPGNFVDFSIAQPFAGKATDTRQPGDFPMCAVIEEGETDTGDSGSTKTFEMCDYRRLTSMQYGVWIIGADTRLPVVSGLRWAAKVALEAPGQDLGLGQSAFITNVAMPSRMQTIDKLMIGAFDCCGGVPRTVCKITITVNYNFPKSAITP